jgi:hypothetical protein
VVENWTREIAFAFNVNVFLGIDGLLARRVCTYLQRSPIELGECYLYHRETASSHYMIQVLSYTVKEGDSELLLIELGRTSSTGPRIGCEEEWSDGCG